MEDENISSALSVRSNTDGKEDSSNVPNKASKKKNGQFLLAYDPISFKCPLCKVKISLNSKSKKCILASRNKHYYLV